jgi:hypothetical protein
VLGAWIATLFKKPSFKNNMKWVEWFNRVSGFYRFPDLAMLEGMRNHPPEQPNNIDII